MWKIKTNPVSTQVGFTKHFSKLTRVEPISGDGLNLTRVEPAGLVCAVYTGL